MHSIATRRPALCGTAISGVAAMTATTPGARRHRAAVRPLDMPTPVRIRAAASPQVRGMCALAREEGGGALYLARSHEGETNRVKVGYTGRHPEARRREFSQGCVEHDLLVITHMHARAIEGFIHLVLSPWASTDTYRARERERFDVPAGVHPDDFAAVCRRAIIRSVGLWDALGPETMQDPDFRGAIAQSVTMSLRRSLAARSAARKRREKRISGAEGDALDTLVRQVMRSDTIAGLIDSLRRQEPAGSPLLERARDLRNFTTSLARDRLACLSSENRQGFDALFEIYHGLTRDVRAHLNSL
mgnify:CR=1 FL=1